MRTMKAIEEDDKIAGDQGKKDTVECWPDKLPQEMIFKL